MEATAIEELVKTCQRTLPHDTRAFEQIVAQYKDRIYALAFRLMGNRQDAEDQAQEVFFKVYRSIRNLDEPATFTTWIFRITTNSCLDALNKQKRRPLMSPLEHSEGPVDSEISFADTRSLGPEDAVILHETRECLERTLYELDTTSRAVLVLRDVEDRPYQEIAETLAISLSAVKMRIHRARLSFQSLMSRICPGLHSEASNTGPPRFTSGPVVTPKNVL